MDKEPIRGIVVWWKRTVNIVFLYFIVWTIVMAKRVTCEMSSACCVWESLLERRVQGGFRRSDR